MLATIFVGLIVGACAKLLMPGKDPGGWIITCLLGIAGAWVAHFIGLRTGIYTENEPAGFVMSVMGSVLLLALYRVLHRRTT